MKKNIYLNMAILPILYFLYFVYAPYKAKTFIRDFIHDLACMLMTLLGIFSGLIETTICILHFASKIAIITVLGVSLVVFANEILSIYGFQFISLAGKYKQWEAFYTKPFVWAATTTIIATSVAISTIKKHELDSKDFVEKQKERKEKRISRIKEQSKCKLDKSECGRGQA